MTTTEVLSQTQLRALAMAPTTYVNRDIPEISLHDFDERIDEITAEVVNAAENVGFFCVVDHDISPAAVDAIFKQSARFFNQPDDIKVRVPFSPQHNAGWEKNAQIRPSTGAVDCKESYQMQFGDGMEGQSVGRRAGTASEAQSLTWRFRPMAQR